MLPNRVNYIALIFASTIIMTLGNIDFSYAQTEFTTDSAQPCFMNYTAGVQMWENCGFDRDFIGATTAGFMYVTGGWFAVALVSVLILAVYVKYQNGLYAMIIGVFFFAFSTQIFPDEWVSFGFVIAAVIVGGYFYNAFVNRTRS